jgi:hypothetical protein
MPIAGAYSREHCPRVYAICRPELGWAQTVTIFYKSKPNWHELSHALRYIAYTKETSSSTDENGYRVLAYAKNYMPLSAWIKLFPATKFTKLTGSIPSILNLMRLKGNHVSEYGERPEQGKRTDLMTTNKTTRILLSSCASMINW